MKSAFKEGATRILDNIYIIYLDYIKIFIFLFIYSSGLDWEVGVLDW